MMYKCMGCDQQFSIDNSLWPEVLNAQPIKNMYTDVDLSSIDPQENISIKSKTISFKEAYFEYVV